METVEPASWPYLLGGAVCLATGFWLRMTGALDGLCRLLGSGPASASERTRIPLLLGFAGGSWLLMWFSMVIPWHGGQRPFVVVILTVALTPLAALAFLGTLLWLVFLRRATK